MIRRSRRYPALLAAVAIVLAMFVLGASPSVQAEPPAQTDDPLAGNERNPVSAKTYYGINFISPEEPWLRYGRESGAGTVRWQFNWRDHEIEPGVWDWEKADDPIRAWRSAGIKIHALLHNPPEFRKITPGSGLVPVNRNLPWDHPENYWARYCENFARRYRGQIASYEIWNEPDLDQYWESNAQEYFYIMKSCYQAIKSVDPSTPVVMAGMAILIERDFMPTVFRLAAEDPQGPQNNFYFDAANIHMYSDPDLVYSLTVYTRRHLNTYGLGYKPIWITETNIALRGYGIHPDTPWYGRATEQEQGWYVIQSAANSLAAGAERLMFFRMSDANMDQAFGLMSNSEEKRPSYRALQLSSELFYDIVAAWREVRQGVIITHMLRADGKRIVVLYSETGQPINIGIEAHESSARLLDANGRESTITADNAGMYVINLPQAPGRDFSQLGNYTVGGPPVILIEGYDPPSAPRPLPFATIDLQDLPSQHGQLLLSWQGGTQVESVSFDVQYSVDNGPWEEWIIGTSEQEALFNVAATGTYSFRVRGIDVSGRSGPYSGPVTTFVDMERPVGTLVMNVVDQRGQGVPYARVQLEDGTLHDADENGVLTLVVEPGYLRVASVDGSAHGRLAPDQPFEIQTEQESSVTWQLEPLQNLITNGEFNFGLQGWQASSAEDVQAWDSRDPDRNQILRMSGTRRPWGAPSIRTLLDVPTGWEGGLLSFKYRILEGGPMLRLRAVTVDSQRVLWQSSTPSDHFNPVLLDMSAYSGQQVMLVFELVGPKGGPPGKVELDHVIFGNVPILNSPEAP